MLPRRNRSQSRMSAKPHDLEARTALNRGLHAVSLLFALLVQLLCAALACSPAVAAPAEAFIIRKPPLKLTVLVGPRNDFCYSDHIQAIEKLAKIERDRINKTGGIAGRQIEIEFRDDKGDARQTVEHVRKALADPQLIALIGLQNSVGAREVFKDLGQKISETGIPWISSIFTTSMIADYPNVYTMQGSQEEESIPVMAESVKAGKFTRPAFIGLKGSPGSEALANGLPKTQDFPAFVADHRLDLPGADSRSRLNAKLEPDQISKVIEDLVAKKPDVIFLSVGGWRVPAFLKEFRRAGITAPLFVGGRLEDIFRSPDVSYAGDVYQITRSELPNLYNNRVRKLLFRERSKEWVFNGDRNQDAFDRIENQCEERSSNAALNVLSRSNLRAIGIGLEFRDMIAMIADIMNSAKPTIDPDDIGAIRKRIVNGIPESFSSGKGIFKGSLEDWSFRPSSRTTVRTPFIITRPKGLNSQQLAALQYVPLKDDRLRKIPTLYLEIDLIRIFRIDDTEKSFSADFYLSMSDENNPNIDTIEFANAFLDPKNNNRQISIQVLHEGGRSDIYPSNMKIYAVSGKFMLDPSYKNYPFDVQRFAIELRPKKGDFPFLIQSLQSELRNKQFDAEGWESKGEYVGYDQDFIPIVDTKTLEQRIIPFYKGSFVWVLKRSANDYYLRVVVPLFFIMIVAYLAIFISTSRFESIANIQVTALLSAVALYITTPKVDSDTATLSDAIFLFNYMVLCLMIGISILRVNSLVAKTLHLKRALAILHVAFIPIFVAIMAFYIYGAGGSESQAELQFRSALRDGFSHFLDWLASIA
jgi:hypothetical protein